MSCDSYTQRSASFIFGPGGGRSWWTHFEFTRINIEPIILCKKIEDLREAGAVMPDDERNIARFQCVVHLACSTSRRAGVTPLGARRSHLHATL
jgi:hypothetical protein